MKLWTIASIVVTLGTAPLILAYDELAYLVAGDEAQARTAALFAQGLQTRGPLELDLGDRIGTL